MLFILLSQPPAGDNMGLLVFCITVPLFFGLVVRIIVLGVLKLIWVVVSSGVYAIWKILTRKNSRQLFAEMETVPVENELL